MSRSPASVAPSSLTTVASTSAQTAYRAGRTEEGYRPSASSTSPSTRFRHGPQPSALAAAIILASLRLTAARPGRRRTISGDNDCAFADSCQPNRMVVFAPRSKSTPPAADNVFGEIYLYVSGDGSPPDTALGTSVLQRIPGPSPIAGNQRAGWNAVSNFVNWGYRPLILTRSGETPRPDGDFVTIRFTETEALLIRTTAISSITVNTDWVTTAATDGPGVK